MAEGILAISVANPLRFAKVETPADGANWENTLVCAETVPDGKRYGYAQRFITGDIIKIYFKSAYTTHVAQLYDELDATVGAAITPTTETTYATYSYFSITLDTSAWSVTKAYHLTLVATHATYDTQTYKSEPIIALATLANHLILRYTNYDTNFEIDYSNLVVEHFIRIPARIHLYKPKGEIDVYSNQGILTKIQEIVQRVLVLESEPIPAYLCEKINVAFAHDVISVNGKEFVKESNPSTARFSKTNLYTLSVELTQTYCIGLNSDDEGFDYVGSGGDTWETVKNFPLNGVTGAQTIDVGAYRDDFRINDIVVTVLSGTGGTIKLGLTAGAEDILAETDLSGFVVGNPQSLYCGAVFGPGQDIVYITITPAAAETYDLDLTLLRYKV
jgi:hypothetical protein